MLYTALGRSPEVNDCSFLAPDSAIIGRCHLGLDVSVWFHATLRGDNEPITIGERSNIQDNCVLHTDPGAPVVIEDMVTVGHGVICHGATLRRECLIGMGSTILNGAVIESHCIVGAGALVTEGKTFPPGSLIVGSPAKVKRTLTEGEIAAIKASADGYVLKAQQFAASLSRSG